MEYLLIDASNNYNKIGKISSVYIPHIEEHILIDNSFYEVKDVIYNLKVQYNQSSLPHVIIKNI